MGQFLKCVNRICGGRNALRYSVQSNPLYDVAMPFYSTSKQPSSLDKTCLWTIVCLFVVLGLLWSIYPQAYVQYRYHSHHTSGVGWGLEETPVLSRTLKCFLLAAAVGFLGFVQLHFRNLFKRDSSRILFRLFLCASAVVLCGALFLAFTTHFWTSDVGPRANEIIANTGAVSTFCLSFGCGVALLNILVSSLRGRRD